MQCLDWFTLCVGALEARRSRVEVWAVFFSPKAKARAEEMDTRIGVRVGQSTLTLCAILVVANLVQPFLTRKKLLMAPLNGIWLVRHGCRSWENEDVGAVENIATEKLNIVRVR